MPRSDNFPDYRDLPQLSRADAECALAFLRLLVDGGACEVYTRPRPAHAPRGMRPRWNLWFERYAWPDGEQRITLEDWATIWMGNHPRELHDLQQNGPQDGPQDGPRNGGDAE